MSTENIETTNENGSAQIENQLNHVELTQDIDQAEDDIDHVLASTNAMMEENLLSENDTALVIAAVSKARRSFRDLSETEKRLTIRKRAKQGQKLLTQSLAGNTAAVIAVTLNHGKLSNTFSQFVPYFDRCIVNLDMKGADVFGKENAMQRRKALADGASALLQKIKAMRKAAEAIVLEEQIGFDKKGMFYTELSVPVPAYVGPVHIHKKESLNHLHCYLELDALLSSTSWMEWFDVRTQKEVNEMYKPLHKELMDLGKRAYFSYIEIVTKPKEQNANASESALKAA